jgi:hypothetical protein
MTGALAPFSYLVYIYNLIDVSGGGFASKTSGCSCDEQTGNDVIDFDARRSSERRRRFAGSGWKTRQTFYGRNYFAAKVFILCNTCQQV